MLRVNALPRRAAAWVLLSAATALVSGVSVAAHAQTASAPTAIKATELEPTPDPSLSFNSMANAMGLFAKYGLTYEAGPKLGGGGPARVQAIVTGNTEVATSDIISVMGGIYSGRQDQNPDGDDALRRRGGIGPEQVQDPEGRRWASPGASPASAARSASTPRWRSRAWDSSPTLSGGWRSRAPTRRASGARHRPHAAREPLASRRRARRGQGLHQASPRRRLHIPRSTRRRCRGWWWWRETIGSRATRPRRRAMSR